MAFIISAIGFLYLVSVFMGAYNKGDTPRQVRKIEKHQRMQAQNNRIEELEKEKEVLELKKELEELKQQK